MTSVFALLLLVCGMTAALPTCDEYANSGAFKPYTIASSTIRLTIIPYGATITHWYVPDRAGTWRDIVLGFDDYSQYCRNAQHPYFGATIGRVANRISNGSFSVDGKKYYLDRNENNYDNLHSGPNGFDRRQLQVLEQTPNSLRFGYISPAGEQGFPGELDFNITFYIKGSQVTHEYSGVVAKQDTIFNPTHHDYFNLHGFMNDTPQILEHVLYMPDVPQYVAVDAHLLPTGVIRNVSVDPWMDFMTAPKAIGKDISWRAQGYDTAFVGGFHAVVHSPLSGITMAVAQNIRNSYQIYTGGYLDGTLQRKASQTFGPNPQYYGQFSAVTFEAQWYPDAINHPEWWNFTDPTIAPVGGPYGCNTTFIFSAK